MNRLFSIAVLLVATTLYAGPGYLKYNQAFGIKASNLSGYGAFYGFKPADEWRLQATGIYYMLDRDILKERRLISNYSVGLEIQKDIIQEDKYRYYLMAGGYYYHDNDETRGRTLLHIIKDSRNAGLGIGYERFFHRVTLGVEAGYKFYWDTSREQEGAGEWLPVLERVTKLGAGLNLGFVF